MNGCVIRQMHVAARYRAQVEREAEDEMDRLSRAPARIDPLEEFRMAVEDEDADSFIAAAATALSLLALVSLALSLGWLL
jgi:hypothetical protein